VKAWAVNDIDRDIQEVIFAETIGQAKSHSEMFLSGTCDFTDLRASRAPEFDDLCGTTITDRDYLARGWWVECSCGRQLDPLGPVVYDRAGNAFCSNICKMKAVLRGLTRR
jgi:hypothetical protein